MIESFALYPDGLPIVAGLLGLVVGSFLNVVAYRLPLMLEAEWRRECRQFLAIETDPPEPAGPRFNLALPASHCTQCRKPLSVLENIPLLSFMVLRGRCAGCGSRISLRYPVTEALGAFLSFLVAWQFGPGVPMLAGLLLTWTLLLLSRIDLDCRLLPDAITLPMLWVGLILSVINLFADSEACILGAVTGYLSLWLVYRLFKLLTGKEGMGHGDFKLLAMLGAWLGWSALPLIILLSSLLGASIGVFMILCLGHDRRQPIPFGPFLAAAGWLWLMWGERLNAGWLAVIGPG